jgi:hypothetical protein
VASAARMPSLSHHAKCTGRPMDTSTFLSLDRVKRSFFQSIFSECQCGRNSSSGERASSKQEALVNLCWAFANALVCLHCQSRDCLFALLASLQYTGRYDTSSKIFKSKCRPRRFPHRTAHLIGLEGTVVGLLY